MKVDEYGSDVDLAGLFMEAGEHHHVAFIESDGVDPEWPLFYAAYVQTKLWDQLGVLITRSELVYLLVGADLAIAAGEETGAWSEVYARRVTAYAARKISSDRPRSDKPLF